MRQSRQHLTYANVMSTIAVVLALGGATAFAASTLSRNSVGTKQLKTGAVTGVKVKDGSLSGADVDVASLGQVPSAITANRATTAEHAKDADHAANVAHADSAATADFATSAATLSPPEDLHHIGAPGEPPFLTGWRAVANAPAPAFYMDRGGRVFLQGTLGKAVGEGNNAMFQMPASYTPAGNQFFLFFNGSLTPGILLVESSGTVSVSSGNTSTVFLNGISWRAGK